MQVRTIAICFLVCAVAVPLLLPHLQVQPKTSGGIIAVPQAAPDALLPANKEPVRRNIRDVTPPGMLQAPSIETDTIVRLPAEPVRKPPPRPPEPILFARPIVVGAGVLKSGTSTVRIAGVDPLAIEASCTMPDGPPWPCGAFAKTAFQRFVRQRTIACAPAGSFNSKKETVTSCTVGGVDLATWLVERGWATPADPSGHQDALARARADRRGQWGDRPQLD